MATIKRANEPGVTPYVPAATEDAVAANEALKADALRTVIRSGLAALLGGASVGAAVGLPTLLKKKKARPSQTELPVYAVKTAADKDLAATIVENVIPTKDPNPLPLSWAWLRGDGVSAGPDTSIASLPWAPAAAAAATAAGAYGGYAGMRGALHKIKKWRASKEREAAKREYEEALQGMVGASQPQTKAAAYVDACFSSLFEKKMTKSAFDGANAGTSLAGLYGILATALASMGAVGSYKYFKEREPSNLIDKALKRRALLRELQNPSGVYASVLPEQPKVQ